MAEKFTAEERARRSALRSKVTAYFLARPYQLIPLADIERIGGRGGWRTRLSETRRYVIEPAGGSLEWEPQYVKIDGQTVPLSFYIYKPHAPIGRDAGAYVQPTLWTDQDRPFAR